MNAIREQRRRNRIAGMSDEGLPIEREPDFARPIDPAVGGGAERLAQDVLPWSGEASPAS